MEAACAALCATHSATVALKTSKENDLLEEYLESVTPPYHSYECILPNDIFPSGISLSSDEDICKDLDIMRPMLLNLKRRYYANRRQSPRFMPSLHTSLAARHMGILANYCAESSFIYDSET